MNRYLAVQHWGEVVMDMKDSEKENGVAAYTTEQLCRTILNVSQTRFRQPVLFWQKRGLEYEQMVELLNVSFDSALVTRVLDNDNFWEQTERLSKTE